MIFPARPFADEPPVDEYERRLAERREAAGRRVLFWYCVTLVPYVGGPVAVFWPGVPGWVQAVVLGAFFVCAGVTGAVTLRHWGVLTREKRVLGLAPWAMCVLMAGPMVLKFLLG